MPAAALVAFLVAAVQRLAAVMGALVPLAVMGMMPAAMTLAMVAAVMARAVVVMVDVFMPAIRERQNNRVVKKTLTIPAWLNAEAEAANVNFSQVLQDGLKSQLGFVQ